MLTYHQGFRKINSEKLIITAPGIQSGFHRTSSLILNDQFNSHSEKATPPKKVVGGHLTSKRSALPALHLARLERENTKQTIGLTLHGKPDAIKLPSIGASTKEAKSSNTTTTNPPPKAK